MKYVELTGDDLPYHLRPDAPPLAECDRCFRQTWSPVPPLGQLCDMPQPDGWRCNGWMVPPPVPPVTPPC